MLNPRSRIITLVGHYGSGKSEIAINLALLLASNQEGRVYLADLDIVNPYFRSREQSELLTEHGIKVISSAEDFSGVDLPYMPESLMAIIQDKQSRGIIDAGGDPAGARVLARYAEKLREEETEVWFVVNGNRPLSKTADDAIKHIESIERASDLRVTGLINNTHLLGSTGYEDIEQGVGLVEEVSQRTNIPIAFHAINKGLTAGFSKSKIAGAAFDDEGNLESIGGTPVLVIDIHLKKPWE